MVRDTDVKGRIMKRISWLMVMAVAVAVMMLGQMVRADDAPETWTHSAVDLKPDTSDSGLDWDDPDRPLPDVAMFNSGNALLPGHFMVKYKEGAMRYSGGSNLWLVNPRSDSTRDDIEYGERRWYVVDKTTISMSDLDPTPPAESYLKGCAKAPPVHVPSGYMGESSQNAWDTYVANNYNEDDLRTYVTNDEGGKFGIFLYDFRYHDNIAGSPDPTWELTEVLPPAPLPACGPCGDSVCLDVSGWTTDLQDAEWSDRRSHSDWQIPQGPYMTKAQTVDGGTWYFVVVLGDHKTAVWFERSGTDYTDTSGENRGYSLTKSGSGFTFTNDNARGAREAKTLEFNDFTQTTYLRGSLVDSTQDACGTTATGGTINATHTDRALTTYSVTVSRGGGVDTVYETAYTYHTGTNKGRLASVTIRRCVDDGGEDWTEISRQTYTYYGATDTGGEPDDEKHVAMQLPDSSGGWTTPLTTSKTLKEYYTGDAEDTDAAWQDTDYTKRMKVTFDTAVSNQRVLVTLTEDDVFYDSADPQGLRFLDSDGTELTYEILEWNVDGESRIWVDGVDEAAGSYIHMYYDIDSGSHWKLDESSGTSAADASGAGHTGTVSGATWDDDGGKIDGALIFDGTDDYVTLGLKPASSEQFF